MWFKLFVLFRLPISAVFLLGHIIAFGVGVLGALLVVGVYVFLAVTSIKLFRLQNGALALAGWLLALETFGAAFLLGSSIRSIATRTFDPTMLFAALCVTVVVWTLPNAAILYRARSLFVGQENKKPGA
jgi:hypothetical protein